MKKLLLFTSILFAGIFISACRKNSYTCSLSYCYCVPLGIDFIGFEPSDLDTLIVMNYKGGTNLTGLLHSDTLIYTSSDFKRYGDTLFLKQNGNDFHYFLELEDSVDYKVIIPSVNHTFTITGTSKGKSGLDYQSDNPCYGRSEAVPLSNTRIDGQPVFPIRFFNDTSMEGFYIFLKK